MGSFRLLAIYRNFPVFLFVVWLTATVLVFIGVVWGQLGNMLADHSWHRPAPPLSELAQSHSDGRREVWDFGALAQPEDPPPVAPAQPEKPAPQPALDVEERSTRLERGGAPANPDNSLLDLRYEGAEGTATLLLHAHAPVQHIKWFNLDIRGNHMTVIDLMGGWATDLPLEQKPDSGPVRRILLGEHPGRLRITLFFRKQYQGRREPQFTADPQGLKVTFDLAGSKSAGR